MRVRMIACLQLKESNSVEHGNCKKASVRRVLAKRALLPYANSVVSAHPESPYRSVQERHCPLK